MDTPSIAAVPDQRPAPLAPCVVYWATPDQIGDLHLGLLSEVERGRRETLRRDEDRDRFTVAAALLRLAVADALDIRPGDVPVVRRCPDCDRPHGKPTIAGTDLRVSVSHSGERIAVALHDGAEIGVDVEKVNPRVPIEQMFPMVLSPAELERLPTDPQARTRAYFVAWTRREAVLKATGDGLRVSMSALTLSGPDEPARLLAFDGRDDLVGHAFLADLRPGDGYFAAVTVLTDGPVEVVETPATALLRAHDALVG